MSDEFKPLAIIGTGTFAEIILKRILGNGFLQPHDIIATTRRPERADYLRKGYGINVELDNLHAAARSRTMMLCVKPQDINVVSESLKTFDPVDRVLISVVAGVSLKKLESLFRSKVTFRANPNPQIELGCGYTAIAAQPDTGERTKKWVEGLFSCLGETTFLNESALDIVSVLSGITHVLYFFDCLIDAGIYLGLPKETTEKIAYQSIMGAMQLWNRQKEPPSEMIRKATTPGGLSVEKILIFEQRGVKAAIIEAMRAAREKAASFNIE